MEKVRNKAYLVEDELCELCPQCWQGECRAFLVPHSEEERKHRESGDVPMLCLRRRHAVATESR